MFYLENDLIKEIEGLNWKLNIDIINGILNLKVNIKYNNVVKIFIRLCILVDFC